ncbi:MAG TPA: hypothetical protein VII49_03565 [Rhizomicrobium sp.]
MVAFPSVRVRRRRLEKLADILEDHAGPIRLFSGLGSVSGGKRQPMRRDCSPFSIAFADPVFRAEGLSGDTMGEASAFFGLTASQSRALVCSGCYFGPVDTRTVATRARFMATHPGVAARVRNFVARFAGVGRVNPGRTATAPAV